MSCGTSTGNLYSDFLKPIIHTHAYHLYSKHVGLYTHKPNGNKVLRIFLGGRGGGFEYSHLNFKFLL